MPIPKPTDGESEDAFIGRCMHAIGNEYDNDQALAICYAKFKEKDMSDANTKLLDAVRSRKGNPNSFAYGISTADAYVRTMEKCVGVEACYKFAATRQTSFNDVIRKAASTLVYGAPDMVVVDQGIEFAKAAGTASPKQYEGIELPKNTLMVFKHILTSPRKDRDGDVLRTQGARPDPKMLLLWQHVHTLPIGKLLQIVDHTSKALKVLSCIVDMNDLCHDAAVMIDNGMGRFSHGFRALDYSELKEADGSTTSPGGFDVKSFEIMEESLVSVPSNVDANVEEVVLDLFEGGKLTSGLMKAQAKHIRSKRPIRIPVTFDLDLVLNKEYDNVGDTFTPTEAESKSAETPCGCGGTCGGCASEEANVNPGEGDKGTSAEATEMTCPKCGEPMVKGGRCKCGYADEKGTIEFTLTEDMSGGEKSPGEMAEPDDADDAGADKVCPECGGAMANGRCTECGHTAPDESKPEDKAAGENCPHCGAAHEQGDNGTCNRCGKPWPKKGFCPTGEGGGIDNSCGRNGGQGGGYSKEAAIEQAVTDLKAAGYKVKVVDGQIHLPKKVTSRIEVASKLEKSGWKETNKEAGINRGVSYLQKGDHGLEVNPGSSDRGVVILPWKPTEENAEPQPLAQRSAEFSVTEAMAIVLAIATPAERATMRRSLDALDKAEKASKRVEDFHDIVGK